MTFMPALFVWPKLHFGQLCYAVVALPILSLALCYAISVAHGDLNPFFPFISDLGGYLPASGFFSFLLAINSYLEALCLFIRYKDVEYKIKNLHYDGSPSLLLRLNFAMLIVGGVSTVCLIAIGSFQDANMLKQIHHLFAVVFFAGGIAYFAGQTCLSTFIEKKMYAKRAAITGLVTLFTLSYAVFSISAKILSPGVPVGKWAPSDRGYTCHIVASLSESLAVLCYLLYFLTYYDDFRAISINIHFEKNILYLQEDGDGDEEELARLLETES